MIRLPAAALGTAAFAMVAATPAVAAELPVRVAVPASVAAAVNQDIMTGAPEDAGWRRRCGWRGCWVPHRGRGGISTGDVLAGVLVIGGIAAIASAASNANRRERVVERVPPPPRPDYRDDRRDYRSSSGIDRAVDMCIDQVERGNTRIDSVDNATRTGDGWRVSGALERGGGWNCWIDNDGRIREIDLGARYGAMGGGVYRADDAGSYSAGADGFTGTADTQLSDEVYLSARENLRANPEQIPQEPLADRPAEPLVDADLAPDAPQPAYPGGPLPGEEGYEEALAGRNLVAR